MHPASEGLFYFKPSIRGCSHAKYISNHAVGAMLLEGEERGVGAMLLGRGGRGVGAMLLGGGEGGWWQVEKEKKRGVEEK